MIVGEHEQLSVPKFRAPGTSVVDSTKGGDKANHLNILRKPIDESFAKNVRLGMLAASDTLSISGASTAGANITKGHD